MHEVDYFVQNLESNLRITFEGASWLDRIFNDIEIKKEPIFHDLNFVSDIIRIPNFMLNKYNISHKIENCKKLLDK